MIKVDPIIAVKDVHASAAWYETVFNCKNKHGGDHFAIMETKDKEVLLCLHPWEVDAHPTMMDPTITPGNGMIMYFRTDKMPQIRLNLEALNYAVEEEIHLNTNSNRMEFSVRDLDGYILSITEMHTYEG